MAALATRRRRGLQPPPSLITVGDGPFAEIGHEFLRYFIDLGGLRPDERVLEIGCGVGRMAIPLTTYLSGKGSYEGFDIVRAEISWCQRNITPRFENFHFHHVDVFNGQANPKGRLKADSFRFPLGGGQFDFVFLTSVFTHMLLDDIENYLRETSRLLKSGGRLLATYFLLDEPTRERLRRTNSRFRYPHDSGLVIDAKMPEASIAHEEGRIRALHETCGLRVQEPVRYGSWSGRARFLSSQDIIVAGKAHDRQE
ncbi:MAG: class I SAM-dependent methyltransferase [Candidatus Aminicenantes bacterium]|nr:class I SAM-dependent methyltransferase [Candidatus Aminicenantes bacterium]